MELAAPIVIEFGSHCEGEGEGRKRVGRGGYKRKIIWALFLPQYSTNNE
jgi:hypothetical protein